jgi:hypothetical protein
MQRLDLEIVCGYCLILHSVLFTIIMPYEIHGVVMKKVMAYMGEKRNVCGVLVRETTRKETI